MVDIEKLKEICADEALSETPSRYITTSEYREAFEAFVEEVSPAAVLELIAENERFKAERDQLRAEAEALRDALETIAAYPYSRDQEMGATAMRKVAQAALAAQKADDALDAARYRWLRTRWGRIADEYDGDSDRLVAIREADSHFEGWDVDPLSLDRAIDAAMAAKEGE